jgi:hypothetical protein
MAQDNLKQNLGIMYTAQRFMRGKIRIKIFLHDVISEDIFSLRFVSNTVPF